jgi:hypothetical protein
MPGSLPGRLMTNPEGKYDQVHPRSGSALPVFSPGHAGCRGHLRHPGTAVDQRLQRNDRDRQRRQPDEPLVPELATERNRRQSDLGQHRRDRPGLVGAGTFADHPAGSNWSTPGATNGVIQFYTSNDRGDDLLVWGGGGPRGLANPVQAVHRAAGGTWSTAATIAAGTYVTIDGAVASPDGTMAVSWESYSSDFLTYIQYTNTYRP